MSRIWTLKLTLVPMFSLLWRVTPPQRLWEIYFAVDRPMPTPCDLKVLSFVWLNVEKRFRSTLG